MTTGFTFEQFYIIIKITAVKVVFKFGDRLMVGQLVLVQSIGVRIPVPEHRKFRPNLGRNFMSLWGAARTSPRKAVRTESAPRSLRQVIRLGVRSDDLTNPPPR